MGEGEGGGKSEEGRRPSSSSSSPCRSAGRSAACCPSPAREERREGRASGRDGWMDHYRLMLCVLARSHSRRAACPPPARARPGWAGRDGHEGKMGSHAKRIQEEPQTNGRVRTDGRPAGRVRLGLSLPLSLPPSFPPPRPHVCLNSECGPSLISSPFSRPLSLAPFSFPPLLCNNSSAF